MLKIKFKIQKKDLLLLVISVVFLIGVGYVIAFGGNQPAVMGHSVGEMDWSQPIPQDIAVNGSIRTIPRSSSTCNAANNGAIYYDSDNNIMYICKNGAWAEFKGPQGAQGPVGPQGLQGIQGPVGPNGPTWECYSDSNSDGPCGTCLSGWDRIMCYKLNDFYNQYIWTCCHIV